MGDNTWWLDFQVKYSEFDLFVLFQLGNPDSVAGDFGEHSLYKMLGYFSLIGLLRLHSLLGDYYQAIKVLENIELNKQVNNSLFEYKDFRYKFS